MALQWACYNGHGGITRQLLARDEIDINVKTTYKSTALMEACKCSNVNVTRLLLARDDVDIKAQDNRERTPLMWACESKNKNGVRLILEHKDVAKYVTARNAGGKTALDIAKEKGYDGIVDILESFLKAR
jgi:ankyrin repeat protein